MKLLIDQNLDIAVASKLTKYLASEKANNPSVVIVRGFTLDDDVASYLVPYLAIIEDTITSFGPSVFSIVKSKPMRVEVLPLGSVS